MSSHLINTLSKEAEIYLLTYRENQSAAFLLSNISNHYQIDRKELLSIFSNKLFTDALALEKFYKTLEPILNEQWDEIINYSNDLVGTYITSALANNSEKINGTCFNSSGVIQFNNFWSMYLNEYLTHESTSPIHLSTLYHQMCQRKISTSGNKIKVNFELTSESLANFELFKSNLINKNPNTKLVALQAKSAKQSKELSSSNLIHIAELISRSHEFALIILSSPDEHEIELTREIEQKCQHSQTLRLVCSLEEASHILMNVDVLITPDTAMKHLADLVDCPSIEISLGESDFTKYSSTLDGSLIVSDNLYERDFKTSKTSILPADIYATLLYFFSKSKRIAPNLSTGVSLYTVKNQNGNIYHQYTCGSIHQETEFRKIITHEFLNTHFQNQKCTLSIENLPFNPTQLDGLCSFEKQRLTQISKDLLGTIRILLQGLDNKRNARDFFIAVDKLITHSENKSILQSALVHFRYKIESLETNTIEASAKSLELILYQLKDQIQFAISTLQEIEKLSHEKRKTEFQQRESNA